MAIWITDTPGVVSSFPWWERKVRHPRVVEEHGEFSIVPYRDRVAASTFLKASMKVQPAGGHAQVNAVLAFRDPHVGTVDKFKPTREHLAADKGWRPLSLGILRESPVSDHFNLSRLKHRSNCEGTQSRTRICARIVHGRGEHGVVCRRPVTSASRCSLMAHAMSSQPTTTYHLQDNHPPLTALAKQSLPEALVPQSQRWLNQGPQLTKVCPGNLLRVPVNKLM